jgi:serine/threonine-protein kinase
VEPGHLVAGRYQVLERIGRGGMGSVYRVRDLALDAIIALKALDAGGSARWDRLTNEVRIARRITHPNVCRVYDLIEDGDRLYLTMELVPGQPLEVRLGDPLDPRTVVEILKDVAAGLAAIHENGVVHRDLKPANILISDGRAVIVDFGLARHEHASERLTAEGTVVGTPEYMAPEQKLGEADARADVFALGLIGFELLTGARPVRHEGLSSPRVLRPDLPEALDRLIASCLEVDRDLRPAGGAQLVEALGRLRAEPRRWRRFGLGAVAALSAAAVAWLSLGRPEAEIVILGSITDRMASEPWARDALYGALQDELEDTHGIPALRLSEAGTRATGQPALTGTISRDRTGALRFDLSIDGAAASVVNDDYFGLVAAIAERVASSVRIRGITKADLEQVGASDRRAYTLWKKARRAGLYGVELETRRLAAEAIAIDPEFPLPHLELASTYEEGEPPAASAIADASRLASGLPEKWREEIAVYEAWHRGDDDGLVRHAKRLEPLARDDLYVQLRFAEVMFEIEENEEGLRLLERARTRWPARAEPEKALARYYLGAWDVIPRRPKSVAAALRHGRRAVELAPRNTGCRALLSLALMLAGERTEAEPHVALASQWSAGDLEATWALFSFHFGGDDRPRAEEAARRLRGDDPLRDAYGRYMQATIDLAYGRFERGFERLEDACRSFEARSSYVATSCYGAAGHYRLELGDRAEAERTFGEAARVGSRGLKVDVELYRALASGTGVSSVLASIEAKAKDSPEGAAGALRAAILAAFVEERWSDVLDHYTSLADTDAIEPWMLYAAGHAFHRQGDPIRARGLLTRLLNHAYAWDDPISYVRAWGLLGRIHDEAGRREEAVRAYRRFLDHWEDASRDLAEIRSVRARVEEL